MRARWRRWAARPRRRGSAAARAGSRATVDLERDLAEYEKAILLRALDQAGGVKKRAAELLGINYRSLRHRLQKYGLADALGRPVGGAMTARQKTTEAALCQKTSPCASIRSFCAACGQ